MNPDAQIPLVIGVTGHRDLLPDDEVRIKERVEAFFSDLQQRFPSLPLLVLTSLAEGADTLVAEMAHARGIAVRNVLPMPREEYLEDFSGPSRQKFIDLAAKADTITLPALQEQRPITGNARDQHYERLGAYLAAHSHILLALWDGTYNQAQGGTGHVINMHHHDADSLADEAQRRSRLDSTDDESDLVYHIVCPRYSSPSVAEGLIPYSTSWYTRDDQQPRAAYLPARYASVFRHMQAFNEDAKRLHPSTAMYVLQPQVTTGRPARSCAAIQSMFGVADALAGKYQSRVLWALRLTLGGMLAAGMSFIVYADFADQDAMIWSYFLFVAVALGSFWTAQSGGWQRRYLDYRVLAESLRVQFYWALAGVEMTNPSRYSHDSFLNGRDLQLGWIRHAMRFTGLYADADEDATEQEVGVAIEEWVGNEDKGQLGYYSRKARARLQQHHNTQRLTAGSFMAGLCTAAVLALGAQMLTDSLNNWLVALMGLLHILAAARQNYAHRLAERELAAQYAHMLVVFRSAHRFLSATEALEVKKSILRDLGEAALNENAQWVLRQRERPLPGGESV